MFRLAMVIVIGLCICGPTVPARADLLWQTLPKDGSWVTFECSEEYGDGTTRQLWVTLKSVGETKSGDVACRWIELKYQNDEARTAGTGSVLKFLIPVKELEPGSDPFAHVIRAWKGTVKEKPTAIDDIASLRHRLNLIISPPIKDLKKSKQRKTVDGPNGKLRCAVWNGTGRYEIASDTVTATYSLGLHDDSPTGAAWAKIEIESAQTGPGIITYTLTASGHNATSDLPDAN